MSTRGRTPAAARPGLRLRYGLMVATLLIAFGAVGGQLIRLGLSNPVGAPPQIRIAVAETILRTRSRPDLVDRNGRLIATEVEVPSIYIDPQAVLDADEVVEKLASRFRDLDAAALRREIKDPARRFVWVRRGVPPRVAQAVHDLGLPGVHLRNEPKRVYTQGRLAAHLIGSVTTDNQGLSGVERWIDEARGNGSLALDQDGRPKPTRLTLDLGVQHGLEAELADAMQRHGATAAAGILLDVGTGAIVAAASLPAPDPARPQDFTDTARLDRLAVGTYELGSIFKTLTVALALDTGQATVDRIYDVRQPLEFGRYTFKDLHPAGRPLSVRDIFILSSNVGVGMIALEAGTEALKTFLGSFGLLAPLRWELGPVAPPQQPAHWGKTETVTIAYGHGVAVAPFQFAVASAALVNGGTLVEPRVIADREPAAARAGSRVITPETSRQIAGLMRDNVTATKGTGRRAEVDGLDIGGKTGTAEIAGKGGYQEKAVISSFLATFPSTKPRYVLLAMVFEPKASPETRGQITAGVIAAPLAARIIQRAAPLLLIE